MKQLLRGVFVVVVLFIFQVFISCQNSNDKSYKETRLTSQRDVILEGTWGSDNNGNAQFAFYGDSIYYPDPNTMYKFTVKKDTLLIFREEKWIEKVLILSYTSDSLILKYLLGNEIISYEKRE